MSLIRAAGRDRNVQQAFAILERLKAASGVTPDVATHNCVLDVCASIGEMSRARALIQDMRREAAVDVITFNTLLKGYCQQGDLSAARSMLEDMKSAGFNPNVISYNLYLNAAVRCNTVCIVRF